MRSSTLTLAQFLPILMASAILTSCGASDQPFDPVGGSPTTPSHTGIAEVFSTPGLICSDAESSAAIGTQAIFMASIKTGGDRLVTTGTLTQAAANSDRFSYSAAPSDRLRLLLADGRVFDFFVDKFDGDFSRDADNFLRRNHALTFRMTRSDREDLQIVERKTGRQTVRTVKGTTVAQGITYLVDLEIEESTFFDIVVSAEFKSQQTMTGSVSTPGISINVDQTDFYHSFTSDNVSEDFRRTINSSWVSGSDRFAFVNGQFSKALRNDKPVDVEDFWNASGTITLNDSPAGQVSFALAGNRMRVQARLNDQQVDLGLF